MKLISCNRITALSLGLMLIPATLPNPADAGILKQGAVRNGYYWQQVSTSKGSRWLCRKIEVGQFQKHVNCKAAGAKKP